MIINMNKIILLSALIIISYAKETKKVVHLPPDQTGKLIQDAMVCIGDTGVNPDALFQIQNGKFSDDERFQNFILCLMRKIGVARKDGHIKIDKALEKFPKGTDTSGVKAAMEECNKESGNSPANTAFLIAKCYHPKTPIHLSI